MELRRESECPWCPCCTLLKVNKGVGSEYLPCLFLSCLCLYMRRSIFFTLSYGMPIVAARSFGDIGSVFVLNWHSINCRVLVFFSSGDIRDILLISVSWFGVWV